MSVAYSQEEVFNFASEEEYQAWYKENAEWHATWWVQQATNLSTKKYSPGAIIPSNALKHTTYKYCDHKGKKKEANPLANQNGGPLKKKRKRADSINQRWMSCATKDIRLFWWPYVRNAMMAKVNSVTRKKHHDDQQSVSRWLSELKGKGYNTLVDIPEDVNGPLSIGWISSW
ncbi:hypothetical protein MUCCIDRAFT_86924 [Mucor lusitanicus CBS 277.49]|uniref:Uncharacterized protein n=1 Tax=Mucor lusitanicus CBS 277.49 TaxID=747725 RepID=A0A168GDW6_MUCCL|nr:hypothetical protein MUCCIDRAFT_86924 [Mucor lusitanicus CBS 277.49]